MGRARLDEPSIAFDKKMGGSRWTNWTISGLPGQSLHRLSQKDANRSDELDAERKDAKQLPMTPEITVAREATGENQTSWICISTSIA